ncbi:Hypothetical protein A7982_05329 [Minicystis rosea]|nr:Hypothetical protein A7982_05329 [Minicystis rosea]
MVAPPPELDTVVPPEWEPVLVVKGGAPPSPPSASGARS